MAFLGDFRRRSLLVSFLRLCLLAAAVNEGVRWLAVGLKLWVWLDVPVMNVGPFFLAAAVLYTVRRWTPAHTALRADDALDFRDRFVSLVDFSGRGDVPGILRDAQAGEVAAALAGVSVRRSLPLRPLLFAAPFVLFVSVFYPNLFTASNVPLFPVGQSPAPRLAGDSHPPPSPEGVAGETPSPDEGAADDQVKTDVADEEAAPGGEQEGAASLAAASLDAEEELRRARPHGTEPGPGDTPLSSETVGEELSDVVDPVYDPAANEEASPEELPEGTMVFRFLPKSAAGKEPSGGGVPADDRSGGILIDLEGVPEAYKVIVKRYFSLLAGDRPAAPAPESPEEGT